MRRHLYVAARGFLAESLRLHESSPCRTVNVATSRCEAPLHDWLSARGKAHSLKRFLLRCSIWEYSIRPTVMKVRVALAYCQWYRPSGELSTLSPMSLLILTTHRATTGIARSLLSSLMSGPHGVPYRMRIRAVTTETSTSVVGRSQVRRVASGNVQCFQHAVLTSRILDFVTYELAFPQRQGKIAGVSQFQLCRPMGRC